VKSSFDDGREWLGKVTIVNNGSNKAFGFVGSESDVQIGSFRFSKDHLQYITRDVGSKESRVLNEWSIEHVDYHQKVSGGRTSNVETENNDISWKDKTFFKVDWSSAQISEQSSFPSDIDQRCWKKATTSLKDDSQEVDADHISFILAVEYQIDPDCLDNENYTRNRQTHTVEYKYSYMPDRKSDYKPYVYTGENDPLFRKYGYFTTVSPFVNEGGRVANTFYMNRWAPGKHRFYFAPGFPEKYKAIYDDPTNGVIARTNKIFADAKIDLSFEIKASDGQKFGDIRYSFINIVEDMDSEAPLGYGPSTAHPRTGEILSANSTLWVSDLKFHLQKIQEQKILAAQRSESTLYGQIKQYLAEDPKDWAKPSGFLAATDQAALFRSLLPEFTYANQGNSFANRQVDELLNADQRLASFRTNQAATNPELNQVFERSAQSAKQLIIDKAMDNRTLQRRSTVWHLSDEMFSGLAQKLNDSSSMESILDDIVYRVAIHEFGHNLNLRHNFYGSVDAASRSDGGVTTSVMDYLDLKDEIGSTHDWEPYDRAALLYAYSSGAIDRIKENKDPYLYCTDEHLRTNPLCNQFDLGASPTQILLNMIAQYDDSYWLRNFRNGRDFWEGSGYSYRAFHTMYEIKKFLGFQDAAFQLGEMQSLLVNRKDLDAKKIAAFQANIQADMDQSARLALAFFASVIKQKSGDRPFKDSFDKSSGALTRIGIADDKMAALRFLMGDDGFALDPNKGGYALSFASQMKEDGPLKDLLNQIISDIFFDAGEMYSGFTEISRLYFMLTAASMPNREASPLDLARIRCYRLDSFLAAFGVPNRDSGTMTFTQQQRPKDLYFSKESALNYLQINGDFYVAGVTSNPLAARLIAAKDQLNVLHAYNGFYSMTEAGGGECR
jgi:hypothetical protein